MTITKQIAAQKLAAYLNHEITLAELVDWAETALLDGKFAEGEEEALRPVVAQLGLVDVPEFGLAWHDCEQLLSALGYRAQVEVFAK